MGSKVCEKDSITLGHKTMDKVDRYGWILRDTHGTFMEIDKAELMVDHDYQRSDVSGSKVRSIARAWSWAGCGAISVALRPNGLFFVFDGQHRVLAAKMRSDITTLPCMVFECDSIAKEAAGFLVTNSERKMVSAIDKFNSLVMTEDQAAEAVERVIREAGLQISKTSTRPGQIKCVSRCLRMAAENVDAFESAIHLAEVLCRDVSHVQEDIVLGLFCIQRRYGLLDDSRFVRRVVDVGHAAIIDGIQRSRIFRQNGGEKTLVEGILAAVNKGLRNRFAEASGDESKE